MLAMKGARINIMPKVLYLLVAHTGTSYVAASIWALCRMVECKPCHLDVFEAFICANSRWNPNSSTAFWKDEKTVSALLLQLHCRKTIILVKPSMPPCMTNLHPWYNKRNFNLYILRLFYGNFHVTH